MLIINKKKNYIFIIVFLLSAVFVSKNVNAATQCETAGGSCRSLLNVTCENRYKYFGGNPEVTRNDLACQGTDACCMPTATAPANSNSSNIVPAATSTNTATNSVTTKGIQTSSGTVNASPSTSSNVYTYDKCITDGGSVAYCAQFSGAPDSAKSISKNSAGDCKFNSDCGSGFTCYQQSCIDDKTYQDNVGWWDRTTNGTGQILSTGGSVFSDNGTSSNKTIATVKTEFDINGYIVPAGSLVLSDGSVTKPDYTQIYPAGTMSSINLTAYADNLNFSSSATNPNDPTLPNNYPTGSNSAECGPNYTLVAGVCMPTTTGLANPQGGILQILSNLFTWLMIVFTILSVMAFVISGIQYLLSTADADLAKKAKSNASNAIIGIVLGLSGLIVVEAISKALTAVSIF